MVSESPRHDADDDLLAEFGQVLREQTGQDSVCDDAIDGYRLEREIHRGGQGVVIAAYQESTKRPVAIKLLLDGALASDQDRARFEREVELVAHLRHPSIVTVHESGSTSRGRPYISMELVDGVRFDVFVQEHFQDGGKASEGQCREIVRLYLGICDAIEYAHRRGVIHRDIKPGNVLVADDGRPVVLDFGIAKAVGAQAGTTKTGEFLGTLSYAAPEQLGSSPDLIDTRADVYALGVMLYEALTGARPSGGDELSLAETVRNVTGQDARRASSVNASVSRDLDAVLRKALERSPAQRYQTAGQLRDELSRAISGMPVRAREHERAYLLRRYLMRRKLPIFAALVVLGGALAMGALWLGQRQEARIAAIESMRATAFLDSLSGVDYQTAGDGVHEIISIEGLLDEMSVSVAAGLEGFPKYEAPVRTKLGLAYLGLRKQFESAERELRRANELYREIYSAPHELIASSYHDLGRVLYRRGEYEAAFDAYQQAYEMRKDLFGEMNLDVARSAQHLAVACRPLGRFEEAGRLWPQVLRIRTELLEPDDPWIASALSGYAWLFMDRFEYQRAKEYFEQSRQILVNRYGESDWRLATVLHGLGLSELELGNYKDSWKWLRVAEAIKRERSDNLSLANTRLAIARLAYYSRTNIEQGYEHAEWAAETFERLNGPEYTDAILSRVFTAGLAGLSGDLPSAEQIAAEAIGVLNRHNTRGENRIVAEGVYADILWALGSYEEARRHALTAGSLLGAQPIPERLTQEAQERIRKFEFRSARDGG